MIEMALVPVLLAFIGYLLLRSDSKENGGLYFWQRNALLAIGARASGLVLDHAEHSPGWSGRLQVHTVDLVVEYRPGEAPPIRVPMSYRLPDGAMNQITEKGKTMPLRYDPALPTRVAIDWPALTGGEPRGTTAEQRQADKERQAALLRGDRK